MAYVVISFLNAVFSFTLLLYIDFLELSHNAEKKILLIIASIAIISTLNSVIGDLMLKISRKHGWGKLTYLLIIQITLNIIACLFFIKSENEAHTFYLAINMAMRTALISVIIHRGKKPWIIYNLIDKVLILAIITLLVLGLIGKNYFEISVVAITLGSASYIFHHIFTILKQEQTSWAHLNISDFIKENALISLSILCSSLVYPMYRTLVLLYSSPSQAYKYALLFQAISIFMVIGSAYATRAAHNVSNLQSEIYKTIFTLAAWFALIVTFSALISHYHGQLEKPISNQVIKMGAEIARAITHMNIYLMPFILSGYLSQIAVRRGLFPHLIFLSTLEIGLIYSSIQMFGYSDHISLLLLPKTIIIMTLIGKINEKY